MSRIKNIYEPNGTKEEIRLGILHSVNEYYVSNEGTKLSCVGSRRYTC